MIPKLGRLRREDFQFEASLSYFFPVWKKQKIKGGGEGDKEEINKKKEGETHFFSTLLLIPLSSVFELN